MPSVPLLQIVDTMAALQALQPVDGSHALAVSGAALNDNGGGFYRFEAAATDTPDAFNNAIISSNSSTGRWIRIFQKVHAYGTSTLVMNANVKTLYTSGTTDSSGNVTLYLTDNQLATGNALFAQIWLISYDISTASTGATTSIIGQRKSISTDLKTVVYSFATGNSTTLGSSLLSIAGLVIPGLKSAAAGITVQFRIDGI